MEYSEARASPPPPKKKLYEQKKHNKQKQQLYLYVCIYNQKIQGRTNKVPKKKGSTH